VSERALPALGKQTNKQTKQNKTKQNKNKTNPVRKKKIIEKKKKKKKKKEPNFNKHSLFNSSPYPFARLSETNNKYQTGLVASFFLLGSVP